MARDESSIENSLGAALFCGMSALAIAGWGYMFLNETYPNLSRLGELMAIGLGIGLAPAWLAIGTWLATLIFDPQRRPHPVWIVASVVVGAIGGLATLAGWATFLGPAV